MSIGFLFFVRDSLSIVIAVAIASSSRILFSNPFAWKVLNLYLTQAIPYDDAKAGAAVAVQSFGDFQNFHPHLHVLATDGCFYNDNAFMVCPPLDTGELEELFRYEVFKMLKAEGKITDVIIENMMNWRHSGFNVYCGKAIWPHNEEGLENLARYIIRASFSQERMTYIAADESANGVAKVLYESKDGKATKTFEQLVKKILKHLDLWDVRRKPPARAHGPPPETFIIYDELSSPGADDYIIDADRTTLRLSTGYPIETYL
jgi:hypothetical protein